MTETGELASAVRSRGDVASGSPIIIIGVSRRSGTNFLSRLLGCHPDCRAPGEPLREDHLLRDAQHLMRYARATVRRWPRAWGDRVEAGVDLSRHLGGGLLAFLQDRTGAGRVVTKTPNPENIHLYPALFPDAYVVLLVRDGRSVTESLVRGFGFSYERAMREWRVGADRMLDFLERSADRSNLHLTIVRYERLVRAFDIEIDRLLRDLDLEPGRFDLHAARDLPVFGSSFIKTPVGSVLWQPVERTDSFDPTARYASWSRLRHERFEWVAGRPQGRLGYGSLATGGIGWAVMNVLLDGLRPVVIGLDLARVAYRRARNVWQRRNNRDAHTEGSSAQSSSP